MEAEAAVPAALPDDVLADILGRLLARGLAASRCVCKNWRDVVDERRLLLRLRHLLPHSVTGIFANYVDHDKAHFFARPTSAGGAPVDGGFSYLPPDTDRFYRYNQLGDVMDHCNGLVLYRGEGCGSPPMYVCNPATRRWVRLPQLAVRDVWRRRGFLAFSPAVSRHYQVLLAPLDLVPVKRQQHDDHPPAGDTEWPPSRWTWHVFSSRTGRWRERVFVRQDDAAGIVADLRMDSLCYSLFPRWRYAVYHQGALYVHCRGEYISRLSLSDGKYHVLKSPIDRSECYKKVQSFLGRSKGEVFFVTIDRRQLRVWMLNDHESQGGDRRTAEWILKHDRVLRPDDWWDGPWILDDYYRNREEKLGVDWSSDDDSIIICNADGEGSDEDDDDPDDTFHFLGFHPYKEVIFLTSFNVAVAYHLNTSKVQLLGILRPADWNYGVHDSFVYTPCYDLCHRG